jgi:hypothetical protein
MNCRLPDLNHMQRIFVAAGFEIETVSADLHGVLQGPAYLDPQGPLNKAWRGVTQPGRWLQTQNSPTRCNASRK